MSDKYLQREYNKCLILHEKSMVLIDKSIIFKNDKSKRLYYLHKAYVLEKESIEIAEKLKLDSIQQELSIFRDSASAIHNEMIKIITE
jgi:hypothetical protein